MSTAAYRPPAAPRRALGDVPEPPTLRAGKVVLYWASMSSVTTDSVSGMPRSLARLSAIASSRRIRPATASLVIGGAGGRAGPPHRRRSDLQPQPPGHQQVLGGVVGEDLQRPLHPGTRRDGGAGGPA